MQETARTKTDAHGNYSIDAPDQGMHLIRVDHQKASYFQPAPPGTNTVDLTVYDVAAKVPGITTEANVMRVETDPQGLHVTQSYFVKNDSTPPKTQFSSRSYEIYLPPDAKVEGAAAMGPGGMPVASSPAPVGDPGHYAYLFPLRPGETQFQVTYSLPYSGSAKFTPKLADKADNVVVMVPKSMTFTPDPSTPYQPINDELNAQTFVAKNVSPTQALGFSVSGSGALPRDVQTAQAAQWPARRRASSPGQSSRRRTRQPHRHSRPAQQVQVVDSLRRRAAAGHRGRLLPPPPGPAEADIASAAADSSRRTIRRAPHLDAGRGAPGHRRPDPSAALPALRAARGAEPDPEAHNRSLLNSLKEELFALEADRARGNVGEVEYAAHKQALEAIIRRALNR